MFKLFSAPEETDIQQTDPEYEALNYGAVSLYYHIIGGQCHLKRDDWVDEDGRAQEGRSPEVLQLSKDHIKSWKQARSRSQYHT